MKKHIKLFYILILLGVTAVFYSPVKQFDFIIDEPILIVERAERLSDLSNIPNYFKEGYWAFEREHTFYYRPIITTVNALNTSQFGLNPSPFHIVNLIIHLLNLFLLFLILSRILKNELRAFGICLIYAIHPFTVQSVAWISGRTDLIAMLFMLISFLMFLQHIKNRKDRVYILLSLFMYFIACFSKETAILFPLIPIVFIFENKSIKKTIRYAILYTIPLIIYLGIRYYVKTTSNGDYAQLLFDAGSLIQIPAVLSHYITRMIVPMKLVFIPNPENFASPGIIAYSISLATVIFFVTAYSIYDKKYRLGIFWFLIFIAPVIQILPVGYPGAAYYLYIPLIGFLIVFSGFVDYVLSMAKKLKSKRNLIEGLIFIAIAMIFAIKGFANMMTFKDEKTTWISSLEKEPENYQALQGIGRLYFKEQNYEKAIIFWEKALMHNPTHLSIYSDLIACYGKTHQFEKADKVYEIAFERNLKYYNVYMNYAFTLINQKRYDRAIEILEKSRPLFDNKAKPDKHIGMVYLYYLADTSKAAEHFEKFLKAYPTDKDSLFLKRNSR